MCKYYVGYSTNSDIRWKASSGGVGTSIIKYLLSTDLFGTTVTYKFNKDTCQYKPAIIYSFEDYNNSGSIYQDIPLVSFIRNNINDIKSGIILTCMPCQVKPIKRMLEQRQIRHFIIELCCSGQTTIEGTWFYYKLLKIDKEDIIHMQYRGNGWPSGIKITMKDGSSITKKNYTYPWTLMHKSQLFRPKRCFYCTKKTTHESDISLADPWLKKFIDNDEIGNSIVIANTTLGKETVNKLLERKLVELKEIDKSTYIKSQLGTIESKAKSLDHRRFNKIVSVMSKDNSIYKKIATSSVLLLKTHNHLIKLLHRHL